MSSEETPRIQECHILTGHLICEIVERALFEPSKERTGETHARVASNEQSAEAKKKSREVSCLAANGLF
jgi:hypothetical protein